MTTSSTGERTPGDRNTGDWPPGHRPAWADELLTAFGTLTATLTAARRQLEAEAATDRERGGEARAAIQTRGRPSPRAPGTVPATLLTGFLGSGKTTVVRSLLTGDHGLRISAIVNDLASVNVDARSLSSLAGHIGGDDGGDGDRPDLAAGRSERAAEIARLQLTNGCACCELTDDLLASLAAAIAPTGAMADDAGAAIDPTGAMADDAGVPDDAGGPDDAGRQPPDAIVVEASGGADPVAMAATIHAAVGVRLDGIVCVADATTIVDQLRHPTLGRLARRQLEAAHLVVLSKVDLAAADLVSAATQAIAEVAPGRPVLAASDGDVAPEVLLGAAVRGATLPVVGPAARPALATRTIEPGPLDTTGLAAWLADDPGLLRAKGWVVDRDGRLHELQIVGRRWTLTPAVQSEVRQVSSRDPVVILIATSADIVDRAADAIDRLAG